MSINLRNNLIIAAGIVAAFLIYLPSMHGTPIWDDFTFWFLDPVMKPEMSYLTIWKDFGWPFSVSLQKVMLALLDHNYLYYHLACFLIHCGNSLLVYKLGRILRLKYRMFYFLLFLFHPVAVITTAWMIQIKTLIAFFFALSSLLLFLKGHKDIRFMILSWLLFGLSITSKSSSITFPLIFLVIHLKLYRFNKIYLLIPFFLLSGWSTYRVLTSKMTIEGQVKADIVTKVKDETPAVTEKPAEPVIVKKEEPVKVVASPPVVVKKEKKKKKEKKVKKVKEKPVVRETKPEPRVETKSEVKVEPKAEVPVEATPPPIVHTPPPNAKTFKIKMPDIGMMSQTLYYYFWQVLMPLNNEPVKGLNYQRAGLVEIVHILFLIILVFIFFKDNILIYLAAAHFLLLPYLGLVPAPYMNITWVSDQHLYLVLPAFLAFWLKIVEKLKGKYSVAIPALFLAFFAFKTYKANFYYKNQFVFYESSLKYDPTNVPMAYNLAFAYLTNGNWQKAFDILENTYYLSESYPPMRKNIFFPYIIHLYQMMKPNHAN